MLNKICFLKGIFIPDRHTLLACRMNLSGLRFTFQSFANSIDYCIHVNPLEQCSGTVVFFTFTLNESKQGEPNPYDIYLHYRDDLDVVHRILLTKPNIKFSLTVSTHDDTIRQHLYLNTLIKEVGNQVGIIINLPTPPPTSADILADTITNTITNTDSIINNLTKLCIPQDASIVDRDLAALMRVVHEHSSLRRSL